MSQARERVLAAVRRSLRRTGALEGALRERLESGLREPRAHLRPHYAGDPIERFVSKLEAVSGMVTRVAEPGEAAGAVDAHLERFGLPPQIVVAPDAALDDVPWSNRLQVERRAARASDRVSVTGCFAGVGETGTLVLLSSAASPTTLNFLPEDHLVVLHADRIVRHLEDVWVRLREEIREPPRTINLITGPSKTADVEQTIQEGAHGPRRLHVILVAAGSA